VFHDEALREEDPDHRSGSGIGLELARRLADDNQVVISGRDEERLARAREEIPGLFMRRLDVTSEVEASQAIAWVESELGGLDVLVNNAGLLRGYRLDDSEAAVKSREDIEVNVLGPIRMTWLALPLLRASGSGAVVYISSAVALAAVPGFSVYATTKAAVHSLARSLRLELRLELGPSGIRVFDVLPPVVETGPVNTLDVPKLSPGDVADAIIDGVERDREEIRVAQVRQLAPIARIRPRLADRLVTRAFTPQPRRGES
jgi:uncharacterized oxidoreductase